MTKDPKIREIKIEGFIGETSEFFLYPLEGVQEVRVDMERVTYMNSVGVKHWMLWVTKIPATCRVLLYKCPYMIASQATTIIGFLPKRFFMESLFAPFVCPECESEKMVLLSRSQHYDYASGDNPHWVKLPNDLTCAKCPETILEEGFFENKIFSFLNL